MARLTVDQWETVRAEREAGASFPELAARHGVSHQAIQKRAKKESWGDGSDLEGAIQRKVSEKVAGVVAGCNPKKRNEAADAEAERRAEVLRRHREEPNAARERIYAGLHAHKAAFDKEGKALAFDDLKAAKIAAEALQIVQAMERKAWGLDESQPAAVVVPRPLVAL